MPIKPHEGGSCTLHLLDSAQGHAVQTWHFQECARITVGRGADNDIRLADAQVSRLHVELLFHDGRWTLHSRGRNGTRVDGESIDEVRLSDRTIFQLGATGPSFQFVTVNDTVSSLATIDNIDPDALAFLVLDDQRQSEALQQITESDSFRSLQEAARRLKGGDPETQVDE